VIWSKRRFFCDEYLCPRRTFAAETAQVPRRVRSIRRLRDALEAAVIGSGRAAAEALLVRCLMVAGPLAVSTVAIDLAESARRHLRACPALIQGEQLLDWHHGYAAAGTLNHPGRRSAIIHGTL
jgi:hypothetical protein